MAKLIQSSTYEIKILSEKNGGKEKIAVILVITRSLPEFVLDYRFFATLSTMLHTTYRCRKKEKGQRSCFMESL